MTTEVQRAIESGFESPGHYLESMRDFDRVLDYLDRTENISEETKEKYHHYFDEIGMDGVFELARNTNELFKELGINSYRLQRVEGYSKGLVNLTPEERIENARKGALITVENKTGVHGLTPEEMSENGRKGGLTRRGRGKWQTPERFKELCEFREESIGKGRKKTYPSWDYVADEFNRRHGTKYLAHQVERAYNRNKDLLSDEEE